MRLDQPFEFRKLGVRKPIDMGVREAAEDQVHLAGAAVPAAK